MVQEGDILTDTQKGIEERPYVFREDCSGRGIELPKLGLGTVLGGFGGVAGRPVWLSALAEENGGEGGGTEPTSQQACRHGVDLGFVLSALRNVYREVARCQ